MTDKSGQNIPDPLFLGLTLLLLAPKYLYKTITTVSIFARGIAYYPF